MKVFSPGSAMCRKWRIISRIVMRAYVEELVVAEELD